MLPFRPFGALAAAAALALGPALSAGAATTVSGDYAVAGPALVGAACTPNCLGTGLHIGGVQFPALGVPVSVAIADQTGGPVPFTVCQDFDGALCGDTGEPRVSGCGTSANLSSSSVAFRSDRPTLVLVRSADVGCQGAGTRGRITVTYA